ncbi:hypothetical protein [Flavobacterium sp.]|uniref:hypothetical protein n=1 Tax=Flavobacterium sp. TaxID=239 RepID=UPI0025C5DAA9|nr:hypothetical protein [Flavobacterium sp.]
MQTKTGEKVKIIFSFFTLFFCLHIHYLYDKLKKEKTAKIENKVDENTKSNSNTNLNDFEDKFHNNDLSSLFSVKIVNGKLTMRHNRLSDVQLTEIDKDKFTGTVTFSVEVSFQRNKKSEITGLYITNFGATNVKYIKINITTTNRILLYLNLISL